MKHLSTIQNVMLTSMILFGFIQTADSQQLNVRPEIYITNPKDNERVGRIYIVRGRLINNRNSNQLWVFVRPPTRNNQSCDYTTDKWYPQDKPVVQGEVWEARVVIGQNPEDINCRYEIGAATFPEEPKEVKQFFENGRKFKAWDPIDIPRGATSGLVTVTVIKESN